MKSPEIKGFGCYPAEIEEENNGDLGLVYRRLGEGDEWVLGGKSPVLLFAIEGTSARTKGLYTEVIADSKNVVLYPSGSNVRLVAKSPVALVAAFFLRQQIREHATKFHHLDSKIFENILSDVCVFRRTTWVNEIGHRYLYERLVLKQRNNIVTQFLELEIAKEVYYLFENQKKNPEQDRYKDIANENLRRVLSYIEENLSSAIRIADLTKVWRTSEATLARAFRSEFKLSPLEYIQARKLDEARMLLQSGRYSASEVAFKFGYSTLSAFSAAFKKRFGEPPSALK